MMTIIFGFSGIKDLKVSLTFGLFVTVAWLDVAISMKSAKLSSLVSLPKYNLNWRNPESGLRALSIFFGFKSKISFPPLSSTPCSISVLCFVPFTSKSPAESLRVSNLDATSTWKSPNVPEVTGFSEFDGYACTTCNTNSVFVCLFVFAKVILYIFHFFLFFFMCISHFVFRIS